MKAVQIYEHGGADKLRYEETEDPVLRSSRDVIVRLRAASLNHIDLWNRKGLTGMQVEFPISSAPTAPAWWRRRGAK